MELGPDLICSSRSQFLCSPGLCAPPERAAVSLWNVEGEHGHQPLTDLGLELGLSYIHYCITREAGFLS